MSVRSEIRDLLAADATLVAILTGGVYAAIEMKRTGETEAAFDANGEIKPCGLVKTATEITDGPTQNSGRIFIDIYLYQFSGFDSIDAAKERIFTLLHRLRISAVKVWEVKWLNDITDQEDPALQCSMHLCRYEAVRYRG